MELLYAENYTSHLIYRVCCVHFDEMVKTRRMIAKGSDNRPKNIIERHNKVKKNSKNAAKLRSKKYEIKNHFASIEELMKLCRPFVIPIKRYPLDAPMEKIKGNVLTKIHFLLK